MGKGLHSQAVLRFSEKPMGSLQQSLENAFALNDLLSLRAITKGILLKEQFISNSFLSLRRPEFCS